MYIKYHFVFSDQLMDLSLEGFGKFYQRGEKDEDGKRVSQTIYFKPSPLEVAEDDPILKKGGVTWQQYSARFNDVSRMTATEERLCKLQHPHRHHLGVLLTQDSDSSSNNSRGSRMWRSARSMLSLSARSIASQNKSSRRKRSSNSLGNDGSDMSSCLSSSQTSNSSLCSQ